MIILTMGGNVPESNESTYDSLDEMYDVLIHRYRRFILYELIDRSALSLQDLTEYVIEWERLSGNDDPNRQQIKTKLHQIHLPALEDADLITYDHNNMTARLKISDQRAKDAHRLALQRAKQ